MSHLARRSVATEGERFRALLKLIPQHAGHIDKVPSLLKFCFFTVHFLISLSSLDRVEKQVSTVMYKAKHVYRKLATCSIILFCHDRKVPSTGHTLPG